MNNFNNITLPEGFDPEERSRRAEENFRKGYNCCQAVLLAFADILEANSLASKEQLVALGSGFGGGMGRLREVCGSFSAAVAMAGFILPACNPGNLEERKDNYALVQEFALSFKQMNGGSIVCRELLGLAKQTNPANQASAGNGAQNAKTAATGALDSEAAVPCTLDSGAAAQVPASAPESPMPSARTEEYYRKRPCGRIIASSALIIARKLKQLSEP